MRHHWPEDTAFTTQVLVPEDRTCLHCGRYLHICDHRHHPIYTLQGPVQLLCKLVHCPDSKCPEGRRTFSPLQESALALPGWLIGWDVFCWIGHRRCARHWSVPQIRAELADSYHIPLSDDAVAAYIDRYQTMLAARHQDPRALAAAYRDIDELILTIDGLQPEKGHETLYVIRELNGKRIWFAEALLSATEAEVGRLIHQAHQWTRTLGKPVRLWISDKQDAFVKGIAAEFPDVPHRYCANHFLRDLAKPLLEKDSHAKVKMRRKVRGLRAIERQVLERRRASEVPGSEAIAPVEVVPVEPADAAGAREQACPVEAVVAAGIREEEAVGAATAVLDPPAPQAAADETGDVVLDYCAAVRGILNDDQGGPLQPPGLRMAEALGEVRASLQRCLEVEDKEGGRSHKQLQRLAGCIDRGMEAVAREQAEIREEIKEVHRVEATLEVTAGSSEQRQERFETIQKELASSPNPIRQGMATLMLNFVAGLFVGGDDPSLPHDNLDLERWFRLPKGHERRIHGRCHAGIRLVQQGATLLPALDAHANHPGPFTAADLHPYRQAQPPPAQQEAMHRRKVMRKARSRKKRTLLLAELERRYREAS
jgi:hypothetical protein